MKKQSKMVAATVGAILLVLTAICLFTLLKQPKEIFHEAILIDTLPLTVWVDKNQENDYVDGIGYLNILEGTVIKGQSGEILEEADLMPGMILQIGEYPEDTYTEIAPYTINSTSITVIGMADTNLLQDKLDLYLDTFGMPVEIYFVNPEGVIEHTVENVVFQDDQIFFAWKEKNKLPAEVELIGYTSETNGKEQTVQNGNSSIVTYEVGDTMVTYFEVSEETGNIFEEHPYKKQLWDSLAETLSVSHLPTGFKYSYLVVKAGDVVLFDNRLDG